VARNPYAYDDLSIGDRWRFTHMTPEDADDLLKFTHNTSRDARRAATKSNMKELYRALSTPKPDPRITRGVYGGFKAPATRPRVAGN